jgi:hypothetical protein
MFNSWFAGVSIVWPAAPYMLWCLCLYHPAHRDFRPLVTESRPVRSDSPQTRWMCLTNHHCQHSFTRITSDPAMSAYGSVEPIILIVKLIKGRTQIMDTLCVLLFYNNSLLILSFFYLTSLSHSPHPHQHPSLDAPCNPTSLPPPPLHCHTLLDVITL